jgi:hypothetical protein
MKKLTLLTLLTLLSAFLGIAQDATAPAKVKKPAVTNSSSETVTGKIGYIGPKKITVKAKGAESSTAFLIDPETKITLNGEPKAVTDLKKGWNASVTPNATNFPTAAVISVTKAAGTAESPAKTEE